MFLAAPRVKHGSGLSQIAWEILPLAIIRDVITASSDMLRSSPSFAAKDSTMTSANNAIMDGRIDRHCINMIRIESKPYQGRFNMSGFDGIKGCKGFSGNASNTSDRFETLLKDDRSSTARFAARFVAGGMLAFGTASCATAEAPYIADGNPAQGGGTVYEPVKPVPPPFIADGNPLQGGGVPPGPIIQDGTPQPFVPQPPFIADGNPLQGGGTIYEPIAPVDPPFIADGNPIQGGSTIYEPVTPVDPPFIADGNPLQGGGTVYEPIAPVDPPFIADGNPIRGGGTSTGPEIQGRLQQMADSSDKSFWKMFRRS